MVMAQMEFEQVIPDRDSSFKVAVFEATHFTAPLHFHPEYELVLIEEGDGICFCGDYNGKFSQGHLALFGRGLPHFYLSDDRFYKATCQEKCRSLYVQFKEQVLPEQYDRMPEFHTIRKMLKDADRGIGFQMRDCCNETIGLIRSLPDAKGIEKILILYRILDILSRSEYGFLASCRFLQHSENSHPICSKVISYLNEHYRQRILLDELAQSVCMNRAALCRRFKSITGKTIVTFLNELRVAYACTLMANTNKSISEIANECGFHNLSHFNSVFKKYTQETPCAYRNVYAVGYRRTD